jgi:hypothetical protein
MKKSKYLSMLSVASKPLEFNLESNACSKSVENPDLLVISKVSKSKLLYLNKFFSVMNYVGLSMQF